MDKYCRIQRTASPRGQDSGTVRPSGPAAGYFRCLARLGRDLTFDLNPQSDPKRANAAFDWWRGELDQALDNYRQRGMRTGPPPRARKHTAGKEARKLGNANAAGADRYETAHAKLTGAGGSHSSSIRRVRHCWLADVDLAPAFVRHNYAVSRTAGDDTSRLHGPRAHPRGHGSAVDCGPRRTCFPPFHHDATLADQAAAPAWWARYSCTGVS